MTISYKMRKKSNAASLFGFFLLLAGIATLTIVALLILVPPVMPESFKDESLQRTSELHFETISALTELQPESFTNEAAITVNNAQERTGSGSVVEKNREQSSTSKSVPNPSIEELPANQQNSHFVQALGQPAGFLQEAVFAQPLRIAIPAIGVDAPVEAVGVEAYQGEEDEEEEYLRWAVPNYYAVGWHHTSAPLHLAGNTVLNGHNNMYGAVFRNLTDLELGDQLFMYDDSGSYEYVVTQRELFEEDGQSIRQRNWNARWMLPTSDERLTLISCWPFETNTHRVVIVAHPVDSVGT